MESMSFCPECGHKVQGGARFCAKCGQQLDSPQAAPDASAAVGVGDQFGLPSRERASWPSRSLLVVVSAVVLAGAGGYAGVQFWTGKIGRPSPSETVRAMVVAANDRQAGAFQQRLSQWFRGEVERAVQREGRPVQDVLAAEFTRSGSIQQIDILAERICAEEASVYFRLRFSDGESRPSYVHLVTENGVWKINGLENVRSTCTVPDDALTRQPIRSWSVSESTEPAAQSATAANTTPTTTRLSRESAAASLERSSEWAKFTNEYTVFTVYIFFTNSYRTGAADTFEAVERAGYISSVSVNGGVTLLAPKGKGDDFRCDTVLSENRCGITLVRPGRVEVTGISSSEREAEVEFNFRWALTPVGRELEQAGLDIAAKIAGLGATHFSFDEPNPMAAALQLYDDGWRVRRVSKR